MQLCALRPENNKIKMNRIGRRRKMHIDDENEILLFQPAGTLSVRSHAH
jgi:hypothetical protein